MAGVEETSLKGGLGGDRSGTVGTKDQDVEFADQRQECTDAGAIPFPVDDDPLAAAETNHTLPPCHSALGPTTLRG